MEGRTEEAAGVIAVIAMPMWWLLAAREASVIAMADAMALRERHPIGSIDRRRR